MTTKDGLIRVKSAFDPIETGSRLVRAIEKRGLLVFCRIDHGKNAAELGQEGFQTSLRLGGPALAELKRVVFARRPPED